MRNLGVLIGQPYGSLYELSPALDNPHRLLTVPEKSSNGMMTDGKDNRDVVDQAENQKLSMVEIEDMKHSCTDGTTIVEALVENSETFEGKTEFAKEKYLSKKQKKYCTTFTALRPTSTTICEAQFDWSAVKSSFLRVDNLAMVLSLANIGPYRRVLVVDNCMGMLAGSAAERMGGFGDLVLGNLGKRTNRLDSLKRFSPHLIEGIHQLALLDLVRVKEECLVSPQEVEAGSEFEMMVEKKGVPREKLKIWMELGFDCCILADWKVHPSALIAAALPLLSPSCSFVIFSSGITALIQCQEMLRKRQDVIMIELQELSWREYQVLPGRTRPEMDAKVPGGYILSGIKVLFQENVLETNSSQEQTNVKKARKADL